MNPHMNPLDQLQDIHLPAQVSAWPPAYGWWLLLLLTIALLVFAFVVLRNKRRHNMARKAAIQQLQRIHSAQPSWQSDINALLKRVCVSYFPAEQVAGLHGSDWVDFLADKLPNKGKTKDKIKAPFVQTMNEWQKQLYQAPLSPDKTSNVQTNQAANFEQVQAQVLVWLQRFNSKTSGEVKHV